MKCLTCGGEHELNDCPQEESYLVDHGLKDTKERESFETGMIREPNLMRGRYELITPIGIRALAKMYVRPPVTMDRNMLLYRAMDSLWSFLEGDRHIDHLAMCSMYCFELNMLRESGDRVDGLLTGIPVKPLRMLAIHYERGAIKYADRNWEKGGPLSRHWNSAMRHLQNILEGDTSEDHASACTWNCFCIIHNLEMMRRGKLPLNLNDMPCYIHKED